MDSIKETKINGVFIISLKQIIDERGAVLHLIRNDSIFFSNFGECYMSELNCNSIKAWKKHTLQTQNFTVPIGRIKLVIFDPRTNSSTFGNIYETVVGRPDSYSRVLIPPGVWYGFKCISNSSALIVNCVDIPHDPIESSKIDYDSEIIPYTW